MNFVRRLQKLAYKILNSRFRSMMLWFHTFFCTVSLRMVFEKDMIEWQPDIVHAHDGISLPLAGRVAKACNAKLVFDSHELETHRNPPLPAIRRMQVTYVEKKYLPRADVVFTVGEKIAGYLEKEYGIRRPTVLYNSPRSKPNPVPIRWDSIGRRDLRSELMIFGRSFLLVHTGNVTFNRGIEQAVIGLSKAADIPEFKDAYPGGIHLALVGNAVPAVVARIESLLVKYGETIKLHFVKPVAPNRIVDFISTADASISAGVPLALSYEFGMPNKLFEAIAAGLPLIASDLVEMKAFIAKHQLGVSYQADDTNRLAEAFLELSLNMDRYRRDAERQADLDEMFCWEAQERKLLDHYKAIS